MEARVKPGGLPAESYLQAMWLNGGTGKRRNGMAADVTEQSSGKARKRSAAKAASRPAASKVKATIHLSADASQRLTVHAAMLGMDRSELVESLINQHLRRFVVSDRGGGDGGNGGTADSGNA